MPLHKNYSLKDHEISLSEEWSAVEKKIFKERMHFYQMNKITPVPGVMKLRILVDPFLDIITTQSVRLDDVTWLKYCRYGVKLYPTKSIKSVRLIYVWD